MAAGDLNMGTVQQAIGPPKSITVPAPSGGTFLKFTGNSVLPVEAAVLSPSDISGLEERNPQLRRITDLPDYSAWPQGGGYVLNGNLYVKWNRGSSHIDEDLGVWRGIKTSAGQWQVSVMYPAQPGYIKGTTAWSHGYHAGQAKTYMIVRLRGDTYTVGVTRHKLLSSTDHGTTWTDIGELPFYDSSINQVPVIYHAFAELPDGRFAVGYHFNNGRVGYALFDPAGDLLNPVTKDIYTAADFGSVAVLVEPAFCYDAATGYLFATLRTQNANTRRLTVCWTNNWGDATPSIAKLQTNLTTPLAPLPITKQPNSTLLIGPLMGRYSGARLQMVTLDPVGLVAGQGNAAISSKDEGLLPAISSGSSGTGVPTVVANGSDIEIVFSSKDAYRTSGSNIFGLTLDYSLEVNTPPYVDPSTLSPAYKEGLTNIGLENEIRASSVAVVGADRFHFWDRTDTARVYWPLGATGDIGTGEFTLAVDIYRHTSSATGVIAGMSSQLATVAQPGAFICQQNGSSMLLTIFGATASDWRRRTYLGMFTSAGINNKPSRLVIIRSAAGVAVYLNEALQYGDETTSGTPPSWSSAVISTYLIQGQRASNGQWFGTIAPARLFNRALSLGEVASARQKGKYDFGDETGGSMVTQSSGTLVVGARYQIVNYVSGDNFLTAGAASNASGAVFESLLVTPAAWANGSTLRRLGMVVNPVVQSINVVADTGLNSISGIVTNAYPMTQQADWVIDAQVTATGDTQLTGQPVFPDPGKVAISHIDVVSSGSTTITVGTTSGGADLVGSVAITAGRTRLTLVTPFPAAASIWVGQSGSATLAVKIRGT